MDEESRFEESRGAGGPEPDGRESEGPAVHPLTRAGLYLAVFLFLQLFVAVPALMIWAVLSRTGPAILVQGEPPVSAFLVVYVCLAPVMVSATLVFLRKLDRRPLASIGARWPADGAVGVAREALWGAGAGVGLLGLWLVAAGLPGELRFAGVSDGFGADAGAGGGAVILGLYLVGFLVQGALEEWVFRGYVYRALRERWSWPTVAGGTSLLFAVLHFMNPGVEPVGLANTFLLGIVLAATVEATGSLWPAAAAHGVWNFTIASVLGLPMSGLHVTALLDLELDGPAWATGGAYGPEGSWLLTGLLVPTVAVAARWVDARREASPSGGTGRE